jgi:hypothetical protein
MMVEFSINIRSLRDRRATVFEQHTFTHYSLANAVRLKVNNRVVHQTTFLATISKRDACAPVNL